MQIGVLDEEPICSMFNGVADCAAGYSHGNVPIGFDPGSGRESQRKLLDGRSHRESADQPVPFASEENRPRLPSEAHTELRAPSDAFRFRFSNDTDAIHKPSCAASSQPRTAVTGNYFRRC